MGTSRVRWALLLTTALAAWQAGPARAQGTDARMNAIEAQIRSLQSELARVRRDLRAARARPRPPAPAPVAAASGKPGGAPAAGGGPGLQLPASFQPGGPGGQGGAAGGAQDATARQQSGQASGPLGEFQIGAARVQLGGFIEAAGIFRTRNEVADIASTFSGIPEGNSVLAHENEFRASARQSRLSLLVQASPSDHVNLAAYFETDFLGAAPTANSNESNSYNLRLRQAYAQYDDTSLGLHVLGGQAWSLLTLYKKGIEPRQEDVPLTIDAQYVPGFTWARQAQLRVAKDFLHHRLWLAASLEEPQTTYFVGPNGAGTAAGTANFNNPGGANLNPSNNYSTDIAPDIVLKAAWDPGFGHYELYGVARFMHDRVSVIGSGNSRTVLAGGGGAATIIPVIPKVLDFQASVLAGYGIGRYGSGQLPDATLDASGSPRPLPEVEALVGLIGHPIPTVDVYGYVGTEQVSRRSFVSGGKGYGYGNPLYVNTGCGTELSTVGCVANTSGLVQGSVGSWWRFIHGPYGTMQVGGQYSYTRRDIFRGIGGARGTDENVFLVSFRYAPFQ